MRLRFWIKLASILMLLSGNAVAWSQPMEPAINPGMGEIAEETPALSAFLIKSREQHVPASFVQQVLGETQQLRAQGLPVAPYLLKANEGLAKGVPPERMLPALQKTRSQSEWAGGLVRRAEGLGLVPNNPAARRAAILNVQDALKNEVPQENLEKVLLKKDGPNSWENFMQGNRTLYPSRVPAHVSTLPVVDQALVEEKSGKPEKADKGPKSHEMKVEKSHQEKHPEPENKKSGWGHEFNGKEKGGHSEDHPPKKQGGGPGKGHGNSGKNK